MTKEIIVGIDPDSNKKIVLKKESKVGPTIFQLIKKIIHYRQN